MGSGTALDIEPVQGHALAEHRPVLRFNTVTSHSKSSGLSSSAAGSMTPSDASGAGPSRPNRRYLPTEGQVLRVLTGIQTTSALVFSGFLSVHLVSPVVAAIGGVSAADKSLLLGRELYLPLEPILVYGPLAVHIVSSSLKRLVITLRARRAPPLTLSIVTGYLLVPFVLPHLLIHRIIPQSPSHPIRHLSPSELGFDFVAHAVKSRPVQSAGAYLGLVALVVPHAWAGSEKIIPWIRRLLGRSGPSFMAGARRKTSRVWMRNVTAALLGVIVVALSRLYSEGDMISLFMARRYEAVFTRGAPWERFVGAW